MDLEIIILNKSDRERQISYDITQLWHLLKKDTNQLICKNRNILTYVENKLTKGEMEGGGINRKLVIYTLLYIINKDLLYNPIQDSVMIDMRKESKKE